MFKKTFFKISYIIYDIEFFPRIKLNENIKLRN